MNLNQDIKLMNSEKVIRYPYDQGNEDDLNDIKKNESEEEKNNLKVLSESEVKK